MRQYKCKRRRKSRQINSEHSKTNNDIIYNNYILLKQIDYFAFSEIFLSFNLCGNIKVAFKREQNGRGKSVPNKAETKEIISKFI